MKLLNQGNDFGDLPLKLISGKNVKISVDRKYFHRFGSFLFLSALINQSIKVLAWMALAGELLLLWQNVGSLPA